MSLNSTVDFAPSLEQQVLGPWRQGVSPSLRRNVLRVRVSCDETETPRFRGKDFIAHEVGTV